MSYRNFKYRLLIMPIIFIAGICVNTMQVFARSADIFTPYLPEIKNSLPKRWVMRLPSVVLFRYTPEANNNKLIVRVFSANTPPAINVSLFTCETGIQPCLLASFTADKQDSFNGKEAFKKHKDAGRVVSLDNNIKGYILAGPLQKQPVPFWSIMWEQDGMFYTVSVMDRERERLRDLAYSMANNRDVIRR